MKPAATSPAVLSPASSKSGTTIVKGAPPKETARITVKPNLPATAVRAGNFAAKPGVVPVPVAAGAGPKVAVARAVPGKPTARPSDAPKPATTIVKSAAAPRVAAATVKPAVGGPPVPAMPAQFQEEASYTLTTALAGVLAVLSWGTAAVLGASYFGLI